MIIRTHLNSLSKVPSAGGDPLTLPPAVAETMRSLHAPFKKCKTMPLNRPSGLAAGPGLKTICVKNGSTRFWFNAFKAQGGPHPAGGCLAHKIHLPLHKVTHNNLKTPEAKTNVGNAIFIPPTDGNHGRCLAWTARKLGCMCIAFMPKGSEEIRQNTLLAEKAQCSVTVCMTRQHA